jgi:putative membrane protein
MKRFVLIAGLACALAAAGSASAQTASAAKQPPRPKPAVKAETQPAKSGTIAAADQRFVKEAAMGGMAEVEMGRLAAGKAANADVRQFGQRMVDDHSKANDELKSWASQNNVTLPTELGAKHKAMQARLSKLSGAAFDRAYMSDMVADHDKDVAAFERASKTVKNADLKAWVDRTLPTLQEHKKSAHEIRAKLGGGAGRGRGRGHKG